MYITHRHIHEFRGILLKRIHSADLPSPQTTDRLLSQRVYSWKHHCNYCTTIVTSTAGRPSERGETAQILSPPTPLIREGASLAQQGVPTAPLKHTLRPRSGGGGGGERTRDSKNLKCSFLPCECLVL